MPVLLSVNTSFKLGDSSMTRGDFFPRNFMEVEDANKFLCIN